MILSNNKVLTRPQYYIHKQPLYQSLIPKPWYRNIKSTDNGVCQYHRALTLFFLSCSRVHVHASTFLLLHYKIYSHYLPTYNHSKQPDNILSLYLHPVHCRNNLSNNLCQLDRTLSDMWTDNLRHMIVCHVAKYSQGRCMTDKCVLYTGIKKMPLSCICNLNRTAPFLLWKVPQGRTHSIPNFS